MREALIDLLRRQIERCYVPPAGASNSVILPIVDIRLQPDGHLAAPPRVARSGGSAADAAVARAAVSAVGRCAPYNLPPRFAPYYDDWKLVRAEFEFRVD